MFLKVLLNYLLGYVNIRVESYFIERFINICTSKKILLWNIIREKSTILYANISIKDYRKIRTLAKKTKSKVQIQKKKGIPFIINRYKKRKIFLILLVAILLCLIIISNFVWNIEITGNSNINKEDLINNLNQYGLTVGTLKSKIDINSIINNIRLNRDDIAWIGITIKGTNAIIEIKETSPAPEVIDNDEYCNIVSDKTGIITKINVQNGTANVQEGDIVQEGDVLVNGYIEGKYTGIRYVHAKAEIKAKVWYSKKEKVYLTQQSVEQTGKTEQKYKILINNFEINLYKTLSNFEKYDTINESEKLKLFSNFYLPIEIVKITNYETSEKEVTYTEEELATITQSKIEQELEEQISNKENIVNKQYNVYKYDGYIEVEVIYEVLEDIGSNQRIVF